VANASRYDAIVATFVGILALAVSAYTAYIQKQQVRAQVLPILQTTHGFSDSDVHFHLANKGSGPAIVKTVRFLVDGKPMKSWLDFLPEAMPKGDYTIHYSNVGHEVLTPGENDEVFSLTSTQVPGGLAKLSALGPKDPLCARVYGEFEKLSTEICYCSTLGDCWTLVDPVHEPSHTDETSRCPKSGPDDFQ
jgi:hypothetical protein